MKTHEAEYQSSATSLALYRRALAALGSSSPDSSRTQRSSPNPPESPKELVEEDHEVDNETSNSSETYPNYPCVSIKLLAY